MIENLTDSSCWKLGEAIEIICEIKDQARIKYNWIVTKDDIEEIIALMDYNCESYNSTTAWLAVADNVDQYWDMLKEQAAQRLWLSMIKEEVETKSTDKKRDNKAI